MQQFLENPSLDAITDWFGQLIIHQALTAPFLLLFLEEAGIPMPIPGDVYLMLIGYQIDKGAISYWVAFALFLIIVLLGSSVLYTLSARWGRHMVNYLGVLFHVNEKKLMKIEKQFQKYGPLVIIFGRHIPGLRIPITIFAGISEIPYRTFIISTFISVVVWIPIYLSLGQKLGKKVLGLFHADPRYTLVLLIPILVFFVLFVISYKNNKKSR